MVFGEIGNATRVWVHEEGRLRVLQTLQTPERARLNRILLGINPLVDEGRDPDATTSPPLLGEILERDAADALLAALAYDKAYRSMKARAANWQGKAATPQPGWLSAKFGELVHTDLGVWDSIAAARPYRWIGW